MVALRTAQMFERDNAATKAALAEFLNEYAERVRATGTVRIDSRNRTLFVDEERVRARATDYLTVRRLLGLLDERGIGSVTITAGVTQDEIVEFVYVVARGQKKGVEDLARELEAAQVRHIQIAPPVEEGVLTGETSSSLHTYSACLDVCEELQKAVKTHGQIRTRRARRVTQAVVEHVLSDEASLLAMSTIKEFDDYLFNHSVNVAILAVAVGQRLSLGKTALGDLCFAAFLHDLGKVEVPREILQKPAPLDPEEWEEIRKHPTNSVLLLLRQQNLSQSTLRAIIGSFEHHINYDMSGYPKVREKSSLSLFGRIITVADRFDAITTAREYRTVNFTPYDGIVHLIMSSRKELDPVIVKLFVEVMGLYPPGTVLGLDTGEVGVVRRPPLPGNPVNRPEIYMVRGLEKGSLVNLADKDANGNYPRNVRLVFNPENEGHFPAVTPDDIARGEGAEPGPTPAVSADFDAECGESRAEASA